MEYRPSAVTNERSPIEERMAVLVIRVGEVNGLVLKSPLYWESIEFLAKDEVSRGIFYALPDQYYMYKDNRQSITFHFIIIFLLCGSLSCCLCLRDLFVQILHHNMAAKSSAATNVSNQSGGTKPSIEDQMANLVKRVGEVQRMVIASPLYWESIELLAKDETLRGVFYAIPDGCKLHFLKRKIRASNEKEAEPFYENHNNDSWHLRSPSYKPPW
ncbi:unnamed protein product [Brassica rapa subsp. narinosa]